MIEKINTPVTGEEQPAVEPQEAQAPETQEKTAAAPAESAEPKRKKGGKQKPKRPWWQELLSWVFSLLGALVLALAIRTFIFEPVRVDGASMNDTLADGEVMYVDKTGYGSAWLCLPWQSAEAKEASPKFTYFGNPSHFDVVICRYPNRGDTNFVKRLIGLPGDTVALENGYLTVNGEAYAEPYVNDEYRSGYSNQLRAVRVPKQGDVITYDETAGFQVNGGNYSYGVTRVTASCDGQKLVLIPPQDYQTVFTAKLDGHRVYVSDGVWYLDDTPQEGNPLAGKSFTVDEDYYFVMGDHRNNSNDSRARGAIPRSYIVGRVAQVVLPLGSWRGVPNGLDVK